MFGAQILAGVVAVALPFDFASAQSPAVRGVYNTATSVGSLGGGFGYGAQSQSTQGINAYGAGSAGTTMNSGLNSTGAMGVGGAQSATIRTALEWEPIAVDSPEYVYRGHADNEPITSLEFFSFSNGYDGYAVLSASADMTAKLWEFVGKYDQETTEYFVTNARVRKNYKDVHKQGLTSAVFSPDYRYVLTSSYDGIGRLWNLNNQENIRAYLGSKDRLWSIAVADSGAYVAAACNDGRVYFWESMTVKKLGYLPNREDASKLGEGFEDVGHEGPVFDVAFSPDSSFVATAGADGTVRIWNLGLQRQVGVIKASEDKVYSVKFSADGAYLITASRDKTARVFNATTRQEVCRFVGHTGAVRKAVFAGNYVCTCSDDGTARLWSMASNSGNVDNNQGMGGMVSSPASGSAMMGIQSSPPYMGGSLGNASLGVSEGKSENGTQKVVGKPARKPGKPKGTELACFNVESPVFSIAVSSDLVYLVTGSADGAARIWRVPGNARHYGDSASGNVGGYGSGGSMGTTGFGADPLANPEMTLPSGGVSGGK